MHHFSNVVAPNFQQGATNANISLRDCSAVFDFNTSILLCLCFIHLHNEGRKKKEGLLMCDEIFYFFSATDEILMFKQKARNAILGL